MKTIKKLTKPERRIAILKDALAQVKRGYYISTCGSVWDLDGILDKKEEKLYKGKDLQKVLTLEFLKQNNCEVCQRGALLLSTIRKENSFKVEYIEDLSDVDNGSFDPESKGDKRLLKLFSAEQIAMMESAFEGCFFNNEIHTNCHKLSKAIEFGELYKEARERQIAILKNAIKNNGIFKP